MIRYRVQIEGLPAVEFGSSDQLPVLGDDGSPSKDTRLWGPERAWDCYKARHPEARQLRRDGLSVVIQVVEMEN